MLKGIISVTNSPQTEETVAEAIIDYTLCFILSYLPFSSVIKRSLVNNSDYFAYL